MDKRSRCVRRYSPLRRTAGRSTDAALVKHMCMVACVHRCRTRCHGLVCGTCRCSLPMFSCIHPAERDDTGSPSSCHLIALPEDADDRRKVFGKVWCHSAAIETSWSLERSRIGSVIARERFHEPFGSETALRAGDVREILIVTCRSCTRPHLRRVIAVAMSTMSFCRCRFPFSIACS